MAEITATIRWFPLGPIEGPKETIKKKGLDDIARQYGASVSLEDTRGAVLGETRGKAIEEITQHIVKVSARDEEAFRGVIRALVKKYRAPRTTYATLGSDERVCRMVEELFDEEDGWQ
jgi:predicted CopG family antitoxin